MSLYKFCGVRFSLCEEESLAAPYPFRTECNCAFRDHTWAYSFLHSLFVTLCGDARRCRWYSISCLRSSKLSFFFYFKTFSLWEQGQTWFGSPYSSQLSYISWVGWVFFLAHKENMNLRLSGGFRFGCMYGYKHECLSALKYGDLSKMHPCLWPSEGP